MNKQSYLARRIFQPFMLFFSAMMVAVGSFAQDKQVDVNINSNKGGGFWGSPWVWVIGAAVFILLLVAILRGGRRSD
jgi:hypothetical protein